MPTDLPSSVRLDPALCLAPGLFRSLAPGERSGDGVEFSYQHGQTSLKFRMPTLLGCDDMRILQAVVALGPREPLAIGEATRSEHLMALRGRLDLAGDARTMDVLAVRTGFAELTRAAGYGQGGDVHGGGLRQHLCACLRRLASVEVVVREPDLHGLGERMMGWRLIAHDLAGDGRCGRLAIALNPRLSQSALARRPFTHVDLRVARSLETNAARLLHQRLSALVGSKSSRSRGVPGDPTAAAMPAKAVRLETMMTYVWAPPETIGDGAPRPGSIRKRRSLLLAALGALGETGWRIDTIPGHPGTRLVSRLPARDEATGSPERSRPTPRPETRGCELGQARPVPPCPGGRPEGVGGGARH